MSKTHAMLEKLGPRIEESLGKRGRTRPQVVELSRQPDPYAGRSRSTNAATIDLDRIIADEQHRERFDEAETASLAESLKSSGLLQPIVVRWDQQRARYVIIAAAVAKGKIKQGRKHSSSKGKKLTFPSPHATITVTVADRGATYHHIEEALQQALEEVQHRIANRVALL